MSATMLATKSARPRRLLVSAVAVSAVLASAACSAAQQSASSASSSSSGPVHNGGALVTAQPNDVDPSSFLKTAVGNIQAEYAVFETLTLIDTKTGQPQGVLAKSWTLAPDAKSLDIKLRDDVTFHSGKKLTAADVIFTIQKVQDPTTGAANSAIANQISDLKADGDYDVKLAFKQPLTNIFDLFETMPIVNKDTYADYAAGQNVDGTGRFEWKSWTPGAKVMLTKYAKYRDAKNTHLDSIEIDVVKDPTALTSAVRSGSVQYAVGMAALDSRSIGSQPGYSIVTSGGSAIPLAFDVTKAPFDNQTVRQAIEYAIDRNRIVQQVEGGQAQASNVPWKPSTVGYDATQAKHYTYQPDKAKQMLAKAGLSGTSFQVLMINTPEMTGIFQIVKNNLAAVGLDAEPVVVQDTDYNARIAARNMGTPAFLMLNGNGLTPASAVTNRPELLANNNVSHFQSDQYSQQVQQVASAATVDKQKTALHDYNAYFVDQAFAAPLIVRPTLSVRSTSVNGISSTQQGFITLGQAWLTK
jgi:peptide/nickel transport system substrate-binding protein